MKTTPKPKYMTQSKGEDNKKKSYKMCEYCGIGLENKNQEYNHKWLRHWPYRLFHKLPPHKGE